MLQGLNKLGEIVYPSPKMEEIVCPGCKQPLIAKCGDIKIHHFAHKYSTICDFAHEPETEWHLNWKKYFKRHGMKIEQMIGDGDFWKTTDVCSHKNKIVLEVQHSPISSTAIEERNTHYQSWGYEIIWIFNAENWNFDFRDKDVGYTFRWKYPHRSLKPLFDPTINVRAVVFDTEYGYFNVLRCYLEEGKTGGWGDFISLEKLLNKIKYKKISWSRKYGEFPMDMSDTLKEIEGLSS